MWDGLVKRFDRNDSVPFLSLDLKRSCVQHCLSYSATMWTRMSWSSGDMRNERISDEERGYLSSGNPGSISPQPTYQQIAYTG